MTPTETEETIKALVQQITANTEAIQQLQEVIAGMNKVFIEMQKMLAK